MLTKTQVENVLNKYYVIEPPKHLLMFDRPAVGFYGDHIAFYKGLQPKWRGDVIIITPQGDDETVIHETLHANYGASEPVANWGGKILVIKSRILDMFPNIRDLFLMFRGRDVHYQRCYGCQLCNNLGEIFIHVPPGAHPQHYVRVR